MELVNVPVLGAPETPDAVLVAVLCLWGDVDFFARFVMDPYVQVQALRSGSSFELGPCLTLAYSLTCVTPPWAHRVA
jgi:hypothetical protein